MRHFALLLLLAATLPADEPTKQLAVFSRNAPGTYLIVPPATNKMQIAVYGIDCNSQQATGIDMSPLRLSLVAGSQTIMPIGHAPLILGSQQPLTIALSSWGLVTCFVTYSFVLVPHQDILGK